MIPCLIFQLSSLGKTGIQGTFMGSFISVLFLLNCFYKALKKKTCYSICFLALLENYCPVKTLLDEQRIYNSATQRQQSVDEQDVTKAPTARALARFQRILTGSHLTPKKRRGWLQLGSVLFQRHAGAGQSNRTPLPSPSECVFTAPNDAEPHL